MAIDSSRRKSFLSLTPVDFSLTAGTNIPAPPDSPPHSPANSTARPPTAGGGPLSSHPPSQEDIPGAFPPTPEPEKEPATKMDTTSPPSRPAARDRNDSAATPASPASTFAKPALPSQNQNQNQNRQSKTPRKLFSLGNLRQSFSSSRTSLHSNYQRPSTDVSQPAPYNPNAGNGSLKRPSSPSVSSAYSEATQPRPSANRSKSGSWFRRKSGMFMMNGDFGEQGQGGLDAVAEDQRSRPATRDSAKRVKETHSPAPLLPEIGSLGKSGGGLSGGDIGWDEGLFGR